jgi:succinate dehydrogenase / fumarate reductase cytochrome b subunit
MSNFLTSSIGKKFIMSITGFFLMSFLVVHLGINLMLLIGSDIFNQAAHFMVSNPIIKVIEPVLGIGFIIHIFYAGYITISNQMARPTGYKVAHKQPGTTWASRNMFILGGLIFVFLVMHMVQFWYKVKFGGVAEITVEGAHMHDTYSLVAGLFQIWWYDVLYMIGAVLLGLHLQHGFWSAFQTIGWSNDLWKKRLRNFGYVYTILIAGGFFIIPLVFLIKTI